MGRSTSEVEPAIRMAISGINVAKGYVERLPEDSPNDLMKMALDCMDVAIDYLRQYAAFENVPLRDYMKT